MRRRWNTTGKPYSRSCCTRFWSVAEVQAIEHKCATRVGQNAPSPLHEHDRPSMRACLSLRTQQSSAVSDKFFAVVDQHHAKGDAENCSNHLVHATSSPVDPVMCFAINVKCINASPTRQLSKTDPPNQQYDRNVCTRVRTPGGHRFPKSTCLRRSR